MGWVGSIRSVYILWATFCGTFTLVQSTPAHPNVRKNEMQPSFKLANIMTIIAAHLNGLFNAKRAQKGQVSKFALI